MQSPGNRKRDRSILAIAALIITTALILLHLYGVKTSTIDNVAELKYELGCRDFNQATCVDDWMWEQRSPYKYRVLGRVSVWALYQADSLLGLTTESALFDAYVACSFLFTFTTVFLLGVLTGDLIRRLYPGCAAGTAATLVRLALLLFALSPPILFFVKYPVRGQPNDLIGYSLMLAALCCLSARRIVGFCLVCVLAAFCRETTLLLPFLFLFFYPLPLRRKLLPALLPVAALASFRLLWPGPYDAFEGARLNLSKPLETACFLLLTFGPLWILALLGYWHVRNSDRTPRDPLLHVLAASFPWSFLLTLAIVSAFASIWEIRIFYVLFFYFVPFAVIGLYQYGERIVQLCRNLYYLLFLLGVLILTCRFWVWMHPLNQHDFLERADRLGFIFFGYWNSPQHNWIRILTAELMLTAACLPFLSLARERRHT